MPNKDELRNMSVPPSREQDELFDELIKYFSQNFDIGSSRWTYSTKSAHSICEQLLRLKRTRLSSPSVPEGWERFAENVVQDVCEIPNRDSPEDFPEACVVTPQELTDIIERNIERLSESQPPLTPSRSEGREKQLIADKDQAYLERNYLVAALTKLFPAGIRATNIEGWLPDWHGCVYIDLPSGQISYHYHDSQAWLFEKLPPYTKDWDNHNKNDVHYRLLKIKPPSHHSGAVADVANLIVNAILDDLSDRSGIPDLRYPDDEDVAASLHMDLCEIVERFLRHPSPTGSSGDATKSMLASPPSASAQGWLPCTDPKEGFYFIKHPSDPVYTKDGDQWYRFKLPTLTQSQGWISINDRLPENKNENVVTYGVVSCLNGIKAYGIGMSCAEDWAEEQKYFEDYVTHWMPLPSPPTAQVIPHVHSHPDSACDISCMDTDKDKDPK